MVDFGKQLGEVHEIAQDQVALTDIDQKDRRRLSLEG